MLMHVVARREEKDARNGETEQETRQLKDDGGRVASRFVSRLRTSAPGSPYARFLQHTSLPR